MKKKNYEIGEIGYIVSNNHSTFRVVKVGDKISSYDEYENLINELYVYSCIEEIPIGRNYQKEDFKIFEVEIISVQDDNRKHNCSSFKVLKEIDIKSMFPHSKEGFITSREILYHNKKYIFNAKLEEHNEYVESYCENNENARCFYNSYRPIKGGIAIANEFPIKSYAIISEFPIVNQKIESGYTINQRGDRCPFQYGRTYYDEEMTKLKELIIVTDDIKKSSKMKFTYDKNWNYMGNKLDLIIKETPQKAVIKRKSRLYTKRMNNIFIDIIHK